MIRRSRIEGAGPSFGTTGWSSAIGLWVLPCLCGWRNDRKQTKTSNFRRIMTRRWKKCGIRGVVFSGKIRRSRHVNWWEPSGLLDLACRASIGFWGLFVEPRLSKFRFVGWSFDRACRLLFIIIESAHGFSSICVSHWGLFVVMHWLEYRSQRVAIIYYYWVIAQGSRNVLVGKPMCYDR
jgi:hypothetical protein